MKTGKCTKKRGNNIDYYTKNHKNKRSVRAFCDIIYKKIVFLQHKAL